MKTEHYDPPTADELAAHEECRRRPDMVDKDMQKEYELDVAAQKVRDELMRRVHADVNLISMENKKISEAKRAIESIEMRVNIDIDAMRRLDDFIWADGWEDEEGEEE